MRFTSFEELARSMGGQKKQARRQNPSSVGSEKRLPKQKAAGPAAPKTNKNSSADSGKSLPNSQATTPEPPESNEETRLFQQAMQGVKPLKANGREVAVTPDPQTPPAPNQSENDAQAYLRDLVHGKVEFELEHTAEFIEGHVRGLDQRTVRKLKAGQISYEAHLDLHGANADGAKLELLEFCRSQYLLGRRCLLIIPGRGRNSPQGRGVLREEVQAWLTQDPLKRVVLAFTTALPKHGGAGALYLLLRKYKKAHGKILWQKYPLNSET
ncbi:MAG: Smr/MutS family protein [Thermodesulfobacteriota bacterium]